MEDHSSLSPALCIVEINSNRIETAKKRRASPFSTIRHRRHPGAEHDCFSCTGMPTETRGTYLLKHVSDLFLFTRSG